MAKAAIPAEVAGAENRRLITFRAAGRLYALGANEVREVVRLQRVVKVPMGPEALLGLGNLRGTVLPVVSLGRLLGAEDETEGDAARIIVVEGKSPVGLRVDRVEALMQAGGASLAAGSEILTGDGDPLRDVVQSASGEPVRVLDLVALLARTFPEGDNARDRSGAFVRPAGREAVAAREQETLIVFTVADQEFALPLAGIVEVLPPQDMALGSTGNGTSVLGMIALRGALAPLLSLHALLNLPSGGRAGMIIMIAIGNAIVGLSVDTVREIVRLDVDALEPVPHVIASRTTGQARIQSIIKLEGGRCLISVLAPDQLFREDIMNRIRREGAAPQLERQTQVNVAERTYLVFSLDKQEYGLAISDVVEVARLPETITRLPKAPDFLKGVTNLRGTVLPVIDQRRRFDLPVGEASEAQRLVVMRVDAGVAGFIVDAVSEVLRVPETAVEPAPVVAGNARVLEGVINMEQAGRMILLLDPAQLLTRTEQGLLDALSRVEEAQSAIDQSAGR